MHDLKKFHVYEGLKESINSYINFYNNKLQERFKNITPPEVRFIALDTVKELTQYPIKEDIHIQEYFDNLRILHNNYILI